MSYPEPPGGWPGTPAQWADKLGELRAEWRALCADLRGHGYHVPKGDRAAEQEYVGRRVLELCRWNHWTVPQDPAGFA